MTDERSAKLKREGHRERETLPRKRHVRGRKFCEQTG